MNYNPDVVIKINKNLEVVHPLYQWEYYNNKFVLITSILSKVEKRRLLAELKRRVEVLS